MLLVVLTGCAGETPTSTPAPAATASVAATPTRQAAVVVTPATDQVGTVTGTLIRLQPNAGATPFTDADIYLGNILKSTEGQEGLVAVDKATSPKAVIDAQGRFVFSNIAPGRYGLMLDTPLGIILLHQPETGGDLIVEVAGGKVLDLGELKYKFDF
jgi:hypothetical protein